MISKSYIGFNECLRSEVLIKGGELVSAKLELPSEVRILAFFKEGGLHDFLELVVLALAIH